MKSIVCYALLLWTASTMAQVGVGPQPAPSAPAIPAPRDVPFAGTIKLAVDTTDTNQKIFRVHETVPVQTSGPMVLLYPQWETSSHAPTAAAANLAGLMIRAGSQRLEWTRDPVDTFAFHVNVPADVTALDVDFQVLSPSTGAVVMTPDLLTLPWQSVVLYPAGWFVRDIPVAATLTMPAGFQWGTSLDVDHAANDGVAFKPTSLETLVDSPVYAGRYFKRIDLAPGAAIPAHLDLVADAAVDLAIKPVQVEKLQSLLGIVKSMIGLPHYEHYDFLVSLSDTLPSDGGLEHLRSSEVNFPANFLANEDAYLAQEDLLAHEYMHSWNGRFRQPADLWTPNFNVPMRDSLLWVYEGQTEFWGKVLAARAGFRSKQQTLDDMAMTAAVVQAHVGRSWKSLQDSNNDPLYMAGPGHRVAWRDWQRREDYYGEGELLWLNVDRLIRELTHDKKSLADFAGVFFGMHAGSAVALTYTFEDIVAALNQVAPYDWSTFLLHRLDTHSGDHVLDGLTRGGYRLVFTNVPSESYRQDALEDGAADLSYSIGMTVNKAGIVRTVAWNGVAFRAGIGLGTQLVSVNGPPYDQKVLLSAVNAAGTTPVKLSIKADGQTRTETLDYHGTLRYPHLQRIQGSPDRLGSLLTGPVGVSKSKK